MQHAVCFCVQDDVDEMRKEKLRRITGNSEERETEEKESVLAKERRRTSDSAWEEVFVDFRTSH